MGTIMWIGLVILTQKKIYIWICFYFIFQSLQIGPTKGKQQLFNFLPKIEYMAYTLAIKETIWLGQLLFDLGKK